MEPLGNESAEESGPLDITYVRHRRIDRLIDTVRYCLEDISLGFDRWEHPHVKGPGFYLAVVSGTSVAAYADPMGDNRWPVGTCRTIFGGIDRFHAAASEVATNRDGAVIASIDGVLQGQMVRLKDPSREELREQVGAPVAYEAWMGSRHMSALDTSARPDVVSTITLSEENGRVTVFVDGSFEDYQRTEIGGRWRREP